MKNKRTKLNIASFLKRKGITQIELAKKLGCSIGLIGNYASYRSVPSYEKCLELLQEGMTISELFGEDIASKEIEQAEAISAFIAKVNEAIVELRNKVPFVLTKGTQK